MNRHKVDHKAILTAVLTDLLNNGCKIEHYVGDNPKRAIAKECLNHASLFACEYCFARAIRFASNLSNSEIELVKLNVVKEKVEKLMNKERTAEENKELKKLKEVVVEMNKKNKPRSHLVWPSSTRNAEHRTAAKVEEIVIRIENEDISAEERRGIVGRSPLMSLPGFNIVFDVPVEYMHAICIGVGKKLIELTFDVGDNRKRITQRKLSSTAQFNTIMKNTKVPGEFPRRVRELDLAVMKASEYRNIIIFFFPHVLSCIEEKEKERLLWLYLAYMVRACILPTEELQMQCLEDIEFCNENFYLLYEKLFGERNCTYNTHVVGSHLMDMRCHGPLTQTSAFSFENFYGEMRNAFTPGTQSPLKQIFEKILIKRALGPHNCFKKLIFSDHDTALECNTLIYVYKHSSYNIYCIVKILEKELICNKIETVQCQFNDAPARLKWEKIGVFEEGPVGTDFIVVLPENVSGKVLRVDKYLITCPNDILSET